MLPAPRLFHLRWACRACREKDKESLHVFVFFPTHDAHLKWKRRGAGSISFGRVLKVMRLQTPENNTTHNKPGAYQAAILARIFRITCLFRHAAAFSISFLFF
jgi:hypothetical protein